MIAKALGVDAEGRELCRLCRRRPGPGGAARQPGDGRHLRLRRVRASRSRPASCARWRSPPTSARTASTCRRSRSRASTSSCSTGAACSARRASRPSSKQAAGRRRREAWCKGPAWQAELKKKDWTGIYLPGAEFGKYPGRARSRASPASSRTSASRPSLTPGSGRAAAVPRECPRRERAPWRRGSAMGRRGAILPACALALAAIVGWQTTLIPDQRHLCQGRTQGHPVARDGDAGRAGRAADRAWVCAAGWEHEERGRVRLPGARRGCCSALALNVALIDARGLHHRLDAAVRLHRARVRQPAGRCATPPSASRWRSWPMSASTAVLGYKIGSGPDRGAAVMDTLGQLAPGLPSR